MSKKLKNIFLRLIGFVVLFFILKTVNLNEVGQLLLKINPLHLLFVFIILIVNILLKTKRWQIINYKQEIEYPFYDSFLVYSVGLFVGTVTFGRLGEFIKVDYLKKEGYSIGKSFGGVFIDRSFDILFFLFMGSTAMFFFNSVFNEYLVIILFVTFLGLVLIIFSIKNQKLLSRIIKNFIPQKYKNSLLYSVKNQNFGTILEGRSLGLLASFTILAWLIYFFQVYLLVGSLGIKIPFFYLCLFLSISALVSLIPITVSGIGTRDATLSLLFPLINLTIEQAITTSLIVLLIYLLASFIGLIAWLINPISL